MYTKESKFLSMVLRHSPQKINLELDKSGWANISDLIDKSPNEIGLSYEVIEELVKNCDKQRFTISLDKRNIRANQGHSFNVDLELTPLKPPRILYHGTATRFMSSISIKGLISGERQYVHLSTNIDTATSVGKRYGNPVVLKICALDMFNCGIEFFKSENNIWLVEHVPAIYLQTIE